MHERPWCFRCDVMRQEAETLRAEVARLKQLLSPMPQEGPSFAFSQHFEGQVRAGKEVAISEAPVGTREADVHEMRWCFDANGSEVG